MLKLNKYIDIKALVGIMSIYYNSSKIASLLGYNYYTGLEEYVDLFVSYLYKNAKELKEFDENDDEIEFKTSNQIVKEKILKSDIEENTKKEIIQIYDNSSDIHNLAELKDNTDLVEKMLTQTEPDLVKEIMPAVKSKLNCSFGTNTENTAIQLFERIYNLQVVENNEKLLKMKYDDFYICGKIDGKVKVEEIEYVVEIKNRKNKFFKNIPKYELIQIILYSKLCKNQNVCFVQKLGNELNVQYLKNVDSDDEMFKEIINRLSALHLFIMRLRNDNEGRKKMMKMSKMRMYIHMKNELTFLPYKKI